MILRRAKVFANSLHQIPIFIEEDTLLAGNGASKPMGLEIDPEYFRVKSARTEPSPRCKGGTLTAPRP